MFEKFAEKHGGKVVSVDFCEDKDVWGNKYRLPSCDGHAVIRVPAHRLSEAIAEADQLNYTWSGFKSITIVGQ